MVKQAAVVLTSPTTYGVDLIKSKLKVKWTTFSKIGRFGHLSGSGGRYDWLGVGFITWAT